MHEFEFIEASCGFPDGASGKERTCQCMKHKRRWFLPGWKDTLEKEMANYSSIRAW